MSTDSNLRSKVVLLIEDNLDDERLTQRALRKNNIVNEVVLACNGEEGLDYLFGKGVFEGRDTDAIPDLTILDLKLPRMDGLDVLKRIRAESWLRSMPVVVLTGIDDVRCVEESYRLGANSFVRKPADAGDFSEAVMMISMYWLLINRTAPNPIKV